MSDQSPNDPKWLDEFEDLANRQLEDGSSCEQVHPVVESWFNKILEGEPPPSRPSIMQAMACLSTEVLHSAPEELVESLMEVMDEDDLVVWVEHILLIGRAFEIGLRSGDLDDL
ncbi:MAG: hypothetical protein K8L97_04860 [Anaerolineae bacterium]|nr:hypothetical protein [Anaerolineae bacterium]